MDPLDQGENVLRDLALLYIALAHGTDQKLDPVEMDLVAQRLQDLQAGVGQGTVLHAIKEALDAYTQEDVQARIDSAILHLRQTVPPGLKARIIKDLTDIGKADDAFLYAEAAFIGELAEAWQLDAEGEAHSNEAWSIFVAQHGAAGWTPIHDLALIYVTLAHRTDEVLHRQEVDAILEKIGEWMPGAPPERLRRVWDEVLYTYEEQPEGRTLTDAVEAVSTTVPAHQRPAILADLQYIAQADGVLLVEERVLIERLAKTWGLSSD
ncbi:MAG TPA: TerB family tellurite resistance protein [Rhodothermales bacterium]|nr:TerB family tellurite resistance protein [Rhodothermales bacterium]